MRFKVLFLVAMLSLGIFYSSSPANANNKVSIEHSQQFREVAGKETSNYRYDQNGRLLYQTNSYGEVTIFQYDQNGNLSSTRRLANGANVFTTDSIDLTTPSYDVYAYGVPTNAAIVQFPTWTEINGQDDLEAPWIQGEKVIDGVWKATILLSKHNYETGTYYTHVYVDGKYYGGIAPTITPSTAVVTAPSSVNLSDKTYEIIIDGVNSRVAQVFFPTWTEANGQDDLEQPWIQGTRDSEHKWKVTIPFSKHGNESGKYITHIYAKDSYGNLIVIGTNITTALSEITTVPSTIDLTTPSYDVYVYGVPTNAAIVQFPTWTEINGQDDLEAPWIQGEKVTDGVWKATILLSKHNYETGTYYTDVYVDGKFYGGIAPTITPSVAVVTAPSSVNLSDKAYEIIIDGVNSEVAQVFFPTCTEANGQDDLEQPWIQGTRDSEHKWKVTIPFSKHGNESGKYITHIYAKDSYDNLIVIGTSVTIVTS